MKDLNNAKIIWGKIRYILTPMQKKLGVLVFVLSIVGALVELLGVTVMLPLVQSLVEPEKLRKYRMIDAICTGLKIETHNGLIMLVITTTIVVYAFKNIFLTFLSWIRAKYAMKINRELALEVMRSYFQKGYNFFRQTNVSIANRGVVSAVAGVNNVISLFFKMLSEVLTIICICIYIYMTDIIMAVAMSVVAGICMALVVWFFRKKSAEAGKTGYREIAANARWFNQIYYGIKEILVMNREDFFIENYEYSYLQMQRAQMKQVIASETPAFMIEGVCVCGIMIGLTVRALGTSNPLSYIPQLASFAVAAFRIMPSLGRISSSFNGIIFQIPAINETYENIYDANKLKERLSSKQLESESRLYSFKEKIEIKNISYRYPDGKINILDNICITIKQGQSIAFVGMSGAGKSTLADVILGLFEPQEGSLTVDGIDIIAHRKLWSNMIGFVPQTPYLIDDTIRHNVAFGIYDKEIDDARVWAALAQAQIESFIKKQEKGLDTIVGDRGVLLSGGQAQRLVIARALYNDPDILIFDEATSALDNETEKALMESINALQGQKTMIIIAHRLTTIKKCDVIYEIKGGKATVKKYEELV